MILLLSPAKKMDFDSAVTVGSHSQPAMLDDAMRLIGRLKMLSEGDIKLLMGLSDKLAKLNFERYQAFAEEQDESNARQALLAFDGDVYRPIRAGEYGTQEWGYASKHVRILSGLYGLLKPLDLIQPYRLEMGTSLKIPPPGTRKFDGHPSNFRAPSPPHPPTPRLRRTGAGGDGFDNLYAFWGSKIAEAINAASDGVVINLASKEYAKAVDKNALKGRLIEVAFKENRDGKLKIIGLFAKRARGLMTQFAIENDIAKPDELKAFDHEGYAFDAALSTGNEWVFAR